MLYLTRPYCLRQCIYTINQGWQVSANSGLNRGLNRFNTSWQKQIFAGFTKHGTTAAALRLC